jgi:hypothetical protein
MKLAAVVKGDYSLHVACGRGNSRRENVGHIVSSGSARCTAQRQISSALSLLGVAKLSALDCVCCSLHAIVYVQWSCFESRVLSSLRWCIHCMAYNM